MDIWFKAFTVLRLINTAKVLSDKFELAIFSDYWIKNKCVCIRFYVLLRRQKNNNKTKIEHIF